MLTIHNLHVAYDKKTEVLQGVNLSLSTGKVHGLVGLNGAGKTTLLNTLFQFITPQKGEIRYNDSLLQRKEMAYLEAENYFYPYITGKEYLDLFQRGEKEFPVDKWSSLFHLPLNDVTDGYSTGMRKKLALLAVLKQQKPFIILDEPFNGLDLESVEILNKIIRQLCSPQRIILITSHIFETLSKNCDEIHHLTDGIIEKSYLPEEYPYLTEKLNYIIHQRTSNIMDSLL